MAGTSAFDLLKLALTPTGGADGSYTLRTTTVAGGAGGPPTGQSYSVWDMLSLALKPTGAADGSYTLNVNASALANGSTSITVAADGSIAFAGTASNPVVTSTGYNWSLAGSSDVMAIGGTAVATTGLLISSHLSTNAPQTALTLNATYSGLASEMVGVRVVFNAPSSGTITAAAGITIGASSNFQAGATYQKYYAYELDPQTFNASVTDWRGLNLSTPTFVGNTPTTAYGIFVNGITGATTSYALFTAGGSVSFTPSQTAVSAAGTIWDGLTVPTSTLTLTGGVTINTATTGVNLATLYSPTVTSSSSTTVSSTAATLSVQGPPTAGGSVTLGQVYGIAVGASSINLVQGGSTQYSLIRTLPHTVTLQSSTNLTSNSGISSVSFDVVTINQSASFTPTVTNAVTLNIVGPPVAGSGVTITNALAINVQAGGTKLNGSLTVLGTSAPYTGTQSVSTSGTPSAFTYTGGAHTTLTLAEASDFKLTLARTVQFGASGTIAVQRAVWITAPTYSSNTATATLTVAATLAIDQAPVAGTNVVMTTKAALWLASTIATTAGGYTGAGILFGSAPAAGIYFGSGAPSISAPQGSIYLNTTGSSTSTRLYVNTTGSTTWTNVTTAT